MHASRVTGERSKSFVEGTAPITEGRVKGLMFNVQASDCVIVR